MSETHREIMQKIHDLGGPAFPVSIPGCGDNGWHGMMLRDWFASQALPSVINWCSPQERVEGESMQQMFARKAYQVADAMLQARAHPSDNRQKAEPKQT